MKNGEWCYFSEKKERAVNNNKTYYVVIWNVFLLNYYLYSEKKE